MNTSAIESLRKMPVVLHLVKRQKGARSVMPVQNLPSLSLSDARDRLLEGASALFAAYGYQAISIRDLAGHLQIKPGSLYHHIESKQALLFELIESSMTDLLYETRQCLKYAPSNEARLERFVQAFICFSDQNPDRLVLITREAVNLSADQAAQLDRLKASYTELLSGIVAADCNLTSVAAKAHATEIAHAVLCMLCGQCHWGSSHHSPVAFRKVLFTYARAIVHAGKDLVQAGSSIALKSPAGSLT
ncbi:MULTISPECIES: TetR/AcrR family transcriptional regulator [Pseudomonas]|nr:MULTISPECIES: TetR/AcrR family transcriptional regulator [Pseudomonas]MCS4061346.1 AcrR family transcriptional regulator [Pseudomonas putida]